jgi:CubicO group peptidase (beta-lactamase class C family)
MKLRDLSIGLGHHASIAEQAAHMYFVTPLAFPPNMPPPGTVDTGYSNTAFDVLAAVIERATGLRYVDHITERVAGAMGRHLPARRGCPSPSTRDGSATGLPPYAGKQTRVAMAVVLSLVRVCRGGRLASRSRWTIGRLRWCRGSW